MKLIYSLLLIVFMGTTLNAQFKLDEHGILLGTRIDADDFDFHKGYEINGGYYFLKKVGKKNFFSLDVKLSYANFKHKKVTYGHIEDNFNFRDSIDRFAPGVMNFKSISIFFPIKYRVHFTKTTPLFWQVGMVPYLILMNASKFNYDEQRIDVKNDILVSETKNLEEKIKQRPYNIDIALLGIGYKAKKFTIDLNISKGGTKFYENEYSRGGDKTSIWLNFYYNLQKT